MYVDYKEEISMEHENLWVCEHCLMAIKSREGNQATLKHYVDNEEWFDSTEEYEQASKCDWCGEVDSEYYYFPELGHKVSCKRCAKEHRKIVKWYTEDLHYIFNSLIKQQILMIF